MTGNPMKSNNNPWLDGKKLKITKEDLEAERQKCPSGHVYLANSHEYPCPWCTVYTCEKRCEELGAENKRLELWIDDLQSGLYINCVFCGHRYPPGSPAIRSKTLYDHIKQCPKHPLSAAGIEIKRLKAGVVDLFNVIGHADPRAWANGNEYCGQDEGIVLTMRMLSKLRESLLNLK